MSQQGYSHNHAVAPRRQTAYHGTSSAFSSSTIPDEDWTQISGLVERRRIQNRIARRSILKALEHERYRENSYPIFHKPTLLGIASDSTSRSRNPQSPEYLAQQIAEILPFNRLTSHAKLFGKAILRQEIMSTIPSPLDARHLIEVKATQGKGLAIFAKEKIPRGTRLIAESPLLKAPINHTTGGADVMRAFNNLSASSQQAYLKLHGYASEDTKKRHNVPPYVEENPLRRKK
ncbi:hypothetical protein V501_02014 [Pseudogymnoascus sp. VKM F-4519 (FW-2642)]|nr:hypothetical protein V501_02014 [Pseudogymnoascus sp. VKM F-4519 (FW-2642)]